jgi:hypothetical protein
VCPGINNVVVVVVTFGIVNSVPSCVERLFIGLLVNGSRSYNLNQRIYLRKKTKPSGLPRSSTCLL